MRHMDIQLIQIENDEFESLFSVVKQGLYSHVDAVFGWCDEFQVNRLKMTTSRIGFTGFISITSKLDCYASSLTKTHFMYIYSLCFQNFRISNLVEG